MNVENMRILTAALRSGDYTQTTGRLGEITPEGVANCCLGVAARLAGCVKSVQRLSNGGAICYDNKKTVAPERAQRWMGTDVGNPPVDWVLRHSHPQEPDLPFWVDVSTLADLNDGGFTFDQIADIIDYFGVR